MERRKNKELRAELAKYKEVKEAAQQWAQLVASGDARTMMQHTYNTAQLLDEQELKKQYRTQRRQELKQLKEPTAAATAATTTTAAGETATATATATGTTTAAAAAAATS
jgi:ketosteroid isomerase-like protein